LSSETKRQPFVANVDAIAVRLRRPAPDLAPLHRRRAAAVVAAAGIAPAPQAVPVADSPTLSFIDTERDLIRRALASTGGNKLRAAKLLGVSRKRLYARLRRYRLD